MPRPMSAFEKHGQAYTALSRGRKYRYLSGTALPRRLRSLSDGKQIAGVLGYSKDAHEAAWSYLYFKAHVIGGAFSVGAEYNKIVTDDATDLIYPTVTWIRNSTGTHGRGSDYILSAVFQLTNLFIDEYLRVNEAVCR